MNRKWAGFVFLGYFLVFMPQAQALVLTWDDIGYSSIIKGNKYIWAKTKEEGDTASLERFDSKLHRYVKANEEEKAAFLELYYKAIQYCYRHIGESPKNFDFSIVGPTARNFIKITPVSIAAYYMQYGDIQKAGQIEYRYWKDSGHNYSDFEDISDGNSIDAVSYHLKNAGAYKELAEFYSEAYQDEMLWLKAGTDVKLLKSNFTEYEKNWPSQASHYLQFMRDWEKAKELAKIAKPKLLDPAVQHHEWFYSDKPEEVLNALKYYHKHNVRFMLEKAAKRKDPVIAAKAKEYLDNPVKPEETTGDENKK